ncbi:15998_t:CDS:2 [Cetraspora pellucida]|uniref:15998_t:CDS:1 n=1 Tax=Cetraspora pellucida TaxID=1433469 RepID=A0A9N9H4G8_9GLOM|nr:15998_t:CDS:2 [Cetraspora pellucida]
MAKVDLKFCPPSDRVVKNEISLKRLEKAQKIVIERDNLPLLNLIDNEFYSEEEEADKINNDNKRLLKLKDAIIWLEANLKISQHSDDKKPFDQATEAFFAEKYPTLSVVSSDSEEVQVLEPHDIPTKIAQIKQAICDSLWKYWGNLKHTCLLATLLDPKLKRMHPISSHLRETAIRVCHQELENITDTIPIQITSSTSSS